MRAEGTARNARDTTKTTDEAFPLLQRRLPQACGWVRRATGFKTEIWATTDKRTRSARSSATDATAQRMKMRGARSQTICEGQSGARGASTFFKTGFWATRRWLTRAWFPLPKSSSHFWFARPRVAPSLICAGRGNNQKCRGYNENHRRSVPAVAASLTTSVWLGETCYGVQHRDLSNDG